MRFSKVTIILLLLFHSKIQCVVILVHGSFANNAEWYTPRGNFFQELERQANQFDHKLIPFSWSGQPDMISIVQGAECLAKVIESYPENEIIILIGHSHGGNVINFASQLLNDPIEELIENQTNNQIHENNYNILNQIELQNDLTKTTTKTKKITKNRIEKVYLLATPVDTISFMPNMRVIKNLYNFYSDGDNIQTVFGSYEKTYSKINGVTNIKIIMKKITLFSNNPGHIQMHDPIIAKWLLHIPENLKINKIGNFENFENEKNSTIFFNGYDFPEYE